MVSLWRGFLDLLADRSGLLLLLVASLSAVVAFAVQRKQDLQARDIKGWLTGGDSWAYYEPQWTKERKLAFFVRHFGDYPAYDVVLRILNEDTEKTPGDPIFVATAITRDRGFDWTEPRDLIFNRTPEPGESRRYMLEISMRSGTIVFQRIHLYERDGEWFTDSKDAKKNQVPITLPSSFKEIQERPRPPREQEPDTKS